LNLDLPPPTLIRPPDWSLDLGIAGRCLIWFAIAAFAFAAFGWLVAPWFSRLIKPAKVGFSIGALCLFGAFVILGVLFATNRLEFEYVWKHGDGTNPLQYRIAGIWSGQEGSFLLWACTSALFGILAVRKTEAYRRWFTFGYAVFLGSIAGILAYESPFGLNLLDGQPVIPISGIGLAPSLINYWVVIHPPTIFMGFGSLTVLVCFAFAALVSGRFTEWIPMVRPWALISLTLVGVGLCMGGFWAYETLGWGGFWMWDPVENVSFVPWVLTIAFVHGVMIQVARNRWTILNLLLGGLPFLLFVYGTFLTRSGVLGDTSVHSFADMDKVALKVLLGFLVVSSLVFFGLWAWRAIQFMRSNTEPDAPVRGIQREGLQRSGTIFLAVLGLGAALGMSVPLFMNLTGMKPKVVDESVYHSILTWAYIPLMFVMGATPLISWRGLKFTEFGKRMFGMICVTFMLTGLTMVVISISPWTRTFGSDRVVSLPLGIKIGSVTWVVFLVSLSYLVIVAGSWRGVELFKRSKMTIAAFLAHAGLALLMMGLIISRGLEQSQRLVVLQAQGDKGLGFNVAYKGQTSNSADRNNKVLFQLTRGTERFVASPGFYYTQQGDQQEAVTRPFIRHYPFYDIYVALQAPQAEEGELTVPLHETVTIDRFVVTYEKKTQQGQPGTPGAKFGAVLKVRDGNSSRELNPTIELSNGGLVDHPVDFSPGISVSVGRVDAATGSVLLKALFKDAAYPIQMFYKPMVMLVWLGTGIMALGGFMSAFYRRRPRKLGQVLASAVSEIESLPEPVGAGDHRP